MSCEHADNVFAVQTNTNAYRNILGGIVFPKNEKFLKLKAKLGCAICLHQEKVSTKPRCLLICAHCKHFACFQEKHMLQHFRKNPQHFISVSFDTGDVFCAACKDFVYPRAVEATFDEAQEAYDSLSGLTVRAWRPTLSELELLSHMDTLPASIPLPSRPTRGLLNMGNTCFLNVVVQALTHTPILRDFLLADVHRCETAAKSRGCLACEMIRITQEIYRPTSTPYVPSNLLHSMWLHASHLAGYEQRDAHEFFITLLTLIHSHLTKSSSSSALASMLPRSPGQPERCDCVVHQVFFGDLKSVISYEGCEHESSTVDPFLDLSLDVVQRGSTSLDACLRSYFRPENIDGLLLCAQCNVKRPAVKQFSLLHLPNVLCFYLKRCHHETKLTTAISFPMELDLAPFLPAARRRSAWHDRYSLYAVLNHSGHTNSGHYIAYVRVNKATWCLCDDQKILPVSHEHVLKTDAYVLLYHKNLPSVKPR